MAVINYRFKIIVLCYTSYLFLHKRFNFLYKRFCPKLSVGSPQSIVGTTLYCGLWTVDFVFMLLISPIRCQSNRKGCMKCEKKLMKGKNWFPIH